MSDIAPIATTKIAQGSAPQALQGSATSGVLANFAGSGNFWDMIFGNLLSGTGDSKDKAAAVLLGAKPEEAKAEITGGETKTAETKTAETTVTNPAIQATGKVETPLAVLQLVLSSQTVDSNGNIVLPEATPENVAKLQKQLDLTNQIINHIKNALPASAEANGVFKNILSKLQTKSDSLQASISALETGVISKDTPADELPLPLLIALGLNPAEIADVTDSIRKLEEKLGREITIEDIISGVGGLIPASPGAQTQIAANFTSKKEAVPVDLDAATAPDSEPTDDLSAKLNGLTVGGEEPAADNGEILNGSEKRELRSQREGTTDIQVKSDNAPVDTQMKKASTSFKENLMNLLNNNNAAQGDMVFPVNSFSPDLDGTLFPSVGPQASSLSLGTTAQAANLTTAAGQAGQTHPATQMLAANIVKATKEGPSEMTLRLDPPELGNVNVRLSFTKDKTVKAHITAEKAETYLMLQRDSFALERALQNAGLDARGDSISFELAQGGTDFNNNGEGGGERNLGGRSNAQKADDGDVIQSTMTWAVDSETGHVRYNIFA